jgi:hypothetical protein
MSYNPNDADNMWQFEDHFRRVSQALFDQTAHPLRQKRNAIYRAALLGLMLGLKDENVNEIAAAVSMIYSQFEPEFMPAGSTQ